MSIIRSTRPAVNSAADSWPAWTDQRWTLGPEATNPLDDVAFLAEVARRPGRCMTDAEFTAWKLAQVSDGAPMAWLPVTPTASVLANLTPVYFNTSIIADDYRPSADFGFAPTITDDLEAVELLNAEVDDHDDDFAYHAFQAERMELAFTDPYDLVSPEELMECGGWHPSNDYDA
jgi:hypothetical protein